jgi:nodulation protein E
MRRIVITGCGVVSPLGKSWEDFSSNLFHGNSAIKQHCYSLDGFDDLELPVAAVSDFEPERDLPRCKVRSWDRVSHFALYAARKATIQAQVMGDQIDALIIGSSTTSVEALDETYWRLLRGSGRISPMMISRSMPNAPVSAVSIDLGICGVSFAVASACNSANQAIVLASEMIRSGSANLAIAGGVEASLTFSNLTAWKAMQVLADDTCRPFCATRSGLVMGEGGALFVLEELEHALSRGVPILAEIIGWGQSSDARSITTPDTRGISKAIESALRHAKIVPGAVEYINAHGTGTKLNDATESSAISLVFGPAVHNLVVSSTKSLHGHLLGGAGAVELAATLAGLEGGFIPPNANLVDKDTGVEFVVPTQPVRRDFSTALSASYAFGGHNSVLAIRKYH